MIVWQEQVGVAGCGIACLAMLTDTTYARVKEEAPWFCDDKCGIEASAMFDFLADAGFAVQRLSPLKGGQLRKPWPCKPFAPAHLVLLWQTREDFVRDVGGRYFGHSHYVVMDEKGVVYDPADNEHIKRKLKDYYKVAFIAGVYDAGSL